MTLARPQLMSVAGALPEHRYDQADITDTFVREILRDGSAHEGMIRRLHRNAGVRTRHLALPIESYGGLADFGQSNDAFIDAGVELGARAVVDALKAVGLTPSDVDLIIAATVTGLAVPSLDARVAAAIGLRSDVVRLPLVGLGCVAGAAGIARLTDHLVGHPDEVAVLMSVELCSLTIQRDDLTVPNFVASGLFGDGAAAVVAAGARRAASLQESLADTEAEHQPRPRVVATRSRLYPDTERAMGWDIGPTGLRIVLDASVPDLVRTHLGGDVGRFLDDHGLTQDDITFYVAHPGGPKVLEAVQEALAIDRDAVQLTWDSLADIGNLSSASVLHVLRDTLRSRPPEPGSFGLLLAMGPGFCSELVLLQMPEAA